ncbi:MAG TPA: hypothetical protein VN282_19665 [Pyrinomonadaceae bacterium]|nr:hypothetical protein [Pyrinomonadaceae bacterium]
MAGYSGTPLPKKLCIKEGARVALVNAPEGFESVLGELPAGAEFVSPWRMGFDVVLLFARSRDELVRHFQTYAARIKSDGSLWVAWPKRASGVETDLAEPYVRRHGLDAGLVDVKVCAVDETWSGLRFVYRLKDRPRR